MKILELGICRGRRALHKWPSQDERGFGTNSHARSSASDYRVREQLGTAVALPVSWTREGDMNVDPDATGRSRFICHAAIAERARPPASDDRAVR
jgi:hypothetical protein